VKPTAPENSSRKTVVAHVILGLDVGGMEQMTADLARALDPGRFIPVVVCLETLGEIAEEIMAEGVRVILLPPMIPIASFIYPAHLVRALRDLGAEVVHIHSGCWLKPRLPRGLPEWAE
jgi:hypothetical protein